MTEMFRWEKFPDNPSTLKEYTADLWRDYVILYGPKHEETPLFEIYLPTSTPTNLVVREIEQKGNKPISRNGLVTAVYKDSFYVHGGFSISNFLGDFHVFDLITHTWRQIEEKKNQPSPRNYHSAALYKNKWIIFGGNVAQRGKAPPEELHVFSFDDEKWELLTTSGDIPKPRCEAMVCVHKDSLYMMGGYDSKVLSDSFVLNLISLKWKKIVSDQHPGKRCSGSIIVYNNAAYLFGGYTGSYSNELWKLRFSDEQWELIPTFGDVPEPRGYHKCICYKNYMYLFGGSREYLHRETYRIKIAPYHRKEDAIFTNLKKQYFIDLYFKTENNF